MLAERVAQTWRGRGLGIGEARVEEAHGFWPGEAPAIARATPARQAEFAAGRAAARRALRAVGLVPYAIPMGADRAPVWPGGVVGSITHHDGYCLAVAARREVHAGLGIDLEPLAPLAADLWPEILTSAEQDWLSRQPEARQGTLARMIFCAKEATYKALYPQTREIVGFDAMAVRPDPEARGFTARLHRRFGPYASGSSHSGRLLCRDGVIVALLALPPSAHCGGNVAVMDEMEMECFQSIDL